MGGRPRSGAACGTTTRVSGLRRQQRRRRWRRFEDWPRLEATVGVGNVGSERVLEKVGFKREGLLRKFVKFKGESRDVIMFSFLSSDPLVD